MTNSIVSAQEAMLLGGYVPPTYGIVRHMVEFVQWQFSLLPEGQYRFDPDSEEGSNIWISADTPIDPTKVGQRPAITIFRSHATFQGMGLGDHLHTDMKTGSEILLDLIPTTVMINVLSRIQVEAERLAWFVARQIRAYRKIIIKTLPTQIHYLGNHISIAPPSPAGALIQNSTDVKWTVVVVSMPVTLQEGTTIMPLNKSVVPTIPVTFRVKDESEE